MKKKLKYFVFLLIVSVSCLNLISCSKQKEKSQATSTSTTTNNNNIGVGSGVQEDGKLLFSNILWNINDSEGSINEDIIPAKSKNIFIDTLGNLHLKASMNENIFYGAEIVADTLFDLGEFVFYINTDLSTLPSNSKLKLRIINPNKGIKSGIVETGIVFVRESSATKTILKQYSINSNSKDIEIRNSPNDLTSGNSKHKIVVVKDAISYLSFDATNNLLEEYTISKYLSNNKNKQSKVKKSNSEQLTFFTPSTKQKLAISLYCCDSREKTEDFEVVISKVTTKSVFSPTSNLASKKSF